MTHPLLAGTPGALVLASRNAKKRQELETILAPLGLAVEPVDAFAQAPEVAETGATFAENAALKSESVCRALGRPALADDSGLCVDALDGAPGVYSARFAGDGADDGANNARLLETLRGVPAEARTARFVCVIALSGPGWETEHFRGTVEGVILEAPRGAAGFGYDPLFFCPALGKTFAEANAEEKHAVSHRGKALAALRRRLAGGGA